MSTAPGGLALGAALYVAVARRLPRPRLPTRQEGPVLAALVTSAITEEWLFRGPVFRALARRLPRLAPAAAAAAFAASHLPEADARALASLLLVGGTLGVAATGHGGLRAAMLAHATYDVLALLEAPE